MLRSHLTLYVGEPLLTEGGTVIVASIPIPEEEWRALEGPNPAAEDEDNRKRPQLNEGDRLFGAYLSGRVNFVEMYYPEGGTYGFDLVPDPRIERPKALITRRIGVGSGSWVNWETNERHVWLDVSTIYVAGTKATENNTRGIRASQSGILNLGAPHTDYMGARVITPTEEQVSEGTFGKYQ